MTQISVLMSVHNGMPYLREAVDSILRQTFDGFEFIVVDDGSSDGTWDFLKKIRDTRFRLVSNRKSIGLSRSLNKAWDLAQGNYLARMDHDDISLPKRLEAQKKYLDSHSRVDVVGTWAQTLGLPREQIWRYPEADEDLRCEMLFNSPLIHSSVMLRRKKFDKHGLRYDPKVGRAQDYELWTRASSHVHFANLQQVLLHYRIHKDQVGQRHEKQQRAAADKVRKRGLQFLGVRFNSRELKTHQSISGWEFPRSRPANKQVENWLIKLYKANKKAEVFLEQPFVNSLERRWWAACRMLVGLGFEAWRIYGKSLLAKSTERSVLAKAQFWAKCLLRELG